MSDPAPRMAFIALSLLSLAALSHASVVDMGLWQFDSNLSDSQALDLLANVSFKPAPSFSPDAWNLASSSLQFSDFAGDISADVVLMPACPEGSNCTRATDIYTVSAGRISRAGKLSFKPNNLFNIDHSSLDEQGAADSAYLPSEPQNLSAPPPQSVPDMAFAFLQQWLGLITLAVVVGLTLWHIWHSRY